MSRRPAPLSLIVLIAAGAAPTGAAAAAPVDLLSHRAAYRLSLGKSDTVSGIESARGALVLEWRADCAGWLSQQRLGIVAEGQDGGPGFTSDVRFSSWEAPDYTRLRFNSRSLENGEEQEAYTGTATLEARGGKGEARYTGGDAEEGAEERTEALPPGTLFPTEHVMRLIEAARGGERIVGSLVFDGSGAAGLSRVTAAIGPEQKAPGSGERRWPVSLAYHDAEGTDELPEVELAFRLAENGVLHDITLNYGDFVLQGELEKLEPLDEPKCE